MHSSRRRRERRKAAKANALVLKIRDDSSPEKRRLADPALAVQEQDPCARVIKDEGKADHVVVATDERRAVLAIVHVERAVGVFGQGRWRLVLTAIARARAGTYASDTPAIRGACTTSGPAATFFKTRRPGGQLRPVEQAQRHTPRRQRCGIHRLADRRPGTPSESRDRMVPRTCLSFDAQ